MIVTLELSVSVRCEVCSVLTPMVGIRNKMVCRNCAAKIDFKAKVEDSRDGGVKYPFGGYYDAVAQAALVLKDGEDCDDARDSHGSPTALRKVAGPACLSCERSLPVPKAGAESLRCDGCGDTVGVRWPDDETRSWDPRITCIVGDGLAARREVREAKTQGTVISCGQCGAPISGDTSDRRRARTCTHCNATNYLGDAAMLALFPQPEWHKSFLVYQVDDKLLRQLYARMVREEDNHYWLEDDELAPLKKAYAELLARSRADAFAETARGEGDQQQLWHFVRDAALSAEEARQLDPRLDDEIREKLIEHAAPALIQRWASSANVDIKRKVAAHKACKREELIALASDADARVREEAAKRSELPHEVLAKLRKDPEERVARNAFENPSYKKGFFEKLFG